MRELFEIAEFLAASWKLANPEERMPTSHGVLDEALYAVKDLLPEAYREVLTFGNTRVGWRCYELPQILYCAQANLLTSEPNPTYLTTSIQIDPGAARRLLKRRSLPIPEARQFGERLKAASDAAKQRVENEAAAEFA